MSKGLESGKRDETKAHVTRRSKGWPPDRRARRATLIRGWQPWRRSTGPKTEAGKARCAMNALIHGSRSQAHIQEVRRVSRALRLAAYNVERLSIFIRLRDARPGLRIKAEVLARDLFGGATEKSRNRTNELMKAEIGQCNQRAAEGASRPRPFAW